VVEVARAAPEHQRGKVEPPALLVRQAGNEFVPARAVRRHPTLHRRDELSRVLSEEPVPVGRVAFEDLCPLGQLRDGLHAAVPRGRERSPAVVDAQDHQAVDSPADPPQGELGVMGMAIPEKYGGAGQDDYRYNVILQEEAAAIISKSLGL
jgi:alkylation response protein AidB-like acyl-CoA dehydrogenase